jgi:hypothetical protein
MPVPINRTGDEFYRPLERLRIGSATELYLGLVHSDGVEATKRRIDLARRRVSSFGIATECGMARSRRPGLVRDLLQIHAAASQEPR